jgi:[acyl-carrier-protein] S-malonyltransferase
MHNLVLRDSSASISNLLSKRLDENQIFDNLALHSNKLTTAWVFAGQGSQVLGMGQDLWQLPYVKSKMQQAEKILGWSVAEICNQETKLNNTRYCQPCLFVVSSFLIDLLKQKGYQPDLVAGFSLGEYIALYAAEVFDFESGLYLIKRRAEIMAEAPPGAMVALLGCDRLALEEAIQTISSVELITDEHSKNVISGPQDAVEWVLSQVLAERIIRINVSKAFHTRSMLASESKFHSVLDEVPFRSAQAPVLSNVDPCPTVEASVIKERLRQHMTSTIYWEKIMICLSINATQVIEVSPKESLTKCFKKSGFNCELRNISSLADIPKNVFQRC